MTAWGRELSAARNLFALRGPAQLVAFTEVRREADTLVTLLRWALRADDVPTVTHVFAALGGYWTLRGLHRELVGTAPDVVAALRSCVPGPADRTAAIVGLVLCGATSAFTDLRTTARAISGLRTLHATGRAEDPVVDALATLLLSIGRPEQGFAELTRLRADPDPAVACLGTMLSAPLAENAGDPVGALRYARRAKELAVATGEAWTTGTVAVTLTQLLAQSGRYAESLAEAVSAREHLERFGADDDLYEIGWTVGLASAATGDVERARSIAADLRHRPAAGRGGFEDRGLIAVLAVAITAECDRHEGNLDAAAAGYTEAWDVVQPARGPAAQWALMAGAARIAAVDEATAPGRTRPRASRPVRPCGPLQPDALPAVSAAARGAGRRASDPDRRARAAAAAAGPPGRARDRHGARRPRDRLRPHRTSGGGCRVLGHAHQDRVAAGLRGPGPRPAPTGARRGRGGAGARRRRDGRGRQGPGRGRLVGARCARGRPPARLTRTPSGAPGRPQVRAPVRPSACTRGPSAGRTPRRPRPRRAG